MPAPQLQPQDVGAQKARPLLKLFFDLVFVFTITQVTHLVAEPHGLLDYLETTLIFVGLMRIYEAFIWLTSNITLQTSQENWLMFSDILSSRAQAEPYLALAYWFW